MATKQREGPRLYKRGRIWWVSVYDADGRRRQRSTQCTERRAAAAVASRLERLAKDPAYAAAECVTVADATARFVKDRESRGASAATIDYYIGKLIHAERIFGDDSPLAKITATGIDHYTEQRLEEKASRHTVGKERSAIRWMLAVAKRRGEYALDPSTVVPPGWRHDYEPVKRRLTPEQADLLLRQLAPGRRAHVAFIFATGASLGPSCRARREDIDTTAGTILVRGSKTEARWRTLPILPMTKGFVDMVLEHGGKDQLFNPWSSTNANRDLRLACKAAKVPRVSPNDLRRSITHWLIEDGTDPTLVALFLGHTSTAMIMRVYGRVQGQRLGRAMCRSTVTDVRQDMRATGTDATTNRAKTLKGGGSR